MPIRKLKNGRWQVDLNTPEKRIRKQFKTKLEASRFEQFILSKTESAKEWMVSGDSRRLSELVKLWYDHHGQTLRDQKKRLSILQALALSLGDPVAMKLKPADFVQYRAERIRNGITPKTLNNELGYCRAVFNELKALSVINYENPLQQVKPFRIQERELTWLTSDQCRELLQVVQTGSDNPHLYLITSVCLATGARWSEAESLKPASVRSGAVTFTGTKSGKNRTVPISPDLELALLSHWKQYGQFTFSLSAFRRALGRVSFTLPRGQASHVLRHTFASHFMQNGGNILTLQKILGHSSLAMTMRYAHLSPDHLKDAIRLNPLHSWQKIGNDGKNATPEKKKP